jgi:hypothetical protein
MGIIILKNKNFAKHRDLKKMFKGEKVILFGFSIGTKSEKLNCYPSDILNSPLVVVLACGPDS